ncbi:MAG: pro-sigmaK processing inhibitor BofA family protein [Selenomonadaceae bacterium]|nr:pro-sigmaK processing inhibitor BofA family protein [Selenomonadaceae bacterium]
MLEFVVAFAVGLILLGILLKLLSLPFRLVWKFITNSVAGAVILWVVSLIGIPVKINIISALVAGIFGVPGVLAIIAYTYL